MNPTAEIATLCQRFGDAHAQRDADAIVECYADDAVIYDLAPPLGRRGMKRDAIAAWFDTWDGPSQIAAADIEIVSGGDAAFTAALNRMRGRQSGADQDIGFRTTMGLRRTEDERRIMHDHSSVPFYMDGSYRAALELQP